MRTNELLTASARGTIKDSKTLSSQDLKLSISVEEMSKLSSPYAWKQSKY
jgi:hypothetical protein